MNVSTFSFIARRSLLLSLFVFLASALAVPGCVPSAGKTVPPSPTSFTPLSAARREVVRFYESGEWNAELERIAARAEQQLTADVTGKKAPAVVFDVDDTLLSNYSRLKARDFAFPGPLGGEGDRRAVDAGLLTDYARPLPAAAPMLRLYARARALGLALFLISERPEVMRPVTRQNLYDAGFAGWTRLFLLPKPSKDDPMSYAQRKEAVREMLADQGIQILAVVGDQDSDLRGENTGIRYKLPNRMYVVE